jgi:hypothetical protein
MIRKNIGIAALIILLFLAFLDYDNDNANKRAGIHRKAQSVLDEIHLYEKNLERSTRFLARLDLLIAQLENSKDTEEQQAYNMAIRDRNEISAKQERIKANGKRLIEVFDNLVEEYNRTTRPIVFGKKGFPTNDWGQPLNFEILE